MGDTVENRDKQNELQDNTLIFLIDKRILLHGELVQPKEKINYTEPYGNKDCVKKLKLGCGEHREKEF